MKIEKLEQRVEILAQKVENGSGGGAPADAYTKAQADAKFETQAHASSTYATKTELGNVDEVPTVGSEDNGKILKATYSEGTGSYSWESAPSTTQVQADWSQTDSSAVDYIKNKPDLSDMATKTWVGAQGFLTDADEVPTVESTDDGKVLTATYSGGEGSYAWATPAAGGLSVETDGTNYWITVNGIRLYFASSAPTGTIPDGSYGIGW